MIEAGLLDESVELKNGTTWYHSGRVIYSGREPNPIGDRIQDARIFERDAEGRLIRTVHARVAHRLGTEEWRFEDAIVRRFDGGDPSAAPELQQAASLTLRLASRRALNLGALELDALRLPELTAYIAENERRGNDAGSARSILHGRLSIAWLPLLFALFAIPLGLAVERTQSLAGPTLQGVAFLSAFLVLREYAGGIAFGLGGASVLLPWVLLALFAGLGGMRLVRVPR